MAKKANADKSADMGRIRNAAIEAYSAVGNTGSFLLAAIRVWIEEMAGRAFDKEQAESIVESVTAARGWAANGRNPKPRQSELRKVLRAYRELPAAADAFKSAHNTDEIKHDAIVVLARRLSKARKDGNKWGEDIQPTLKADEVTATVTAMVDEADASGTKKKNATKAEQRKSAVDMLKKLSELRSNWMPKGFHDDVAAMLKKFD